MMPLEDYGDLIFKGILAFSVTVGWAIILYPIFYRYRKPWYSLCGVSAGVTFGIFFAKELADATPPGFDEFLSYGLGIFFSIAVLTFLFLFQQNRLNLISKDSAFFRKHELDERIPLRNILQVSAEIEEEGKNFYYDFAGKTKYSEARELCLWLVKEEEAHRDLLIRLLGHWLPRPVDELTTSAILQKFHSRGVFRKPPSADSPEEIWIQYALLQESLMADIYGSFEEAFPEIWKRLRIQQLVNEEMKHTEKILSWKKKQNFCESGILPR